MAKGDGVTTDLLSEMLEEIQDWRDTAMYDPDMSGCLKLKGHSHKRLKECMLKYVVTPMEYREGHWQECEC